MHRSITPDCEAFVDIESLPECEALPRAIMMQSSQMLPVELVRHEGGKIRLSGHLAESYQRVLSTNFTKMHWSLTDPHHVTDTVNWCALGGSFLADFCMDPDKPRIFAWGLNPLKEAFVLGCEA